MNLTEFKELPIMGIVRGIRSEYLADFLDTVIAAGLKTLEITMNTAGAPELIARACVLSGGRLSIGAGTILTLPSAEAAAGAGAGFLVSPVLVRPVADYCSKRRIPYFPGALTPQEIFTAGQSGAAMVKVFPAACFGPAYIKEVQGPLSEIPLMAVGGISADTVTEYFRAGCAAVGFGGRVFASLKTDCPDFRAIAAEVRELVMKTDAALTVS